MVFECSLQTSEGEETWCGSIQNLLHHRDLYELRIESRSRILVLIGKTSYGYFACIPDFGVGCHLAHLKDKFWNEEKLCHILGTIDGLTVAQALYEVADTITEY